MNLDIDQKVALVSAGGGGIGNAIAKQLANEGAVIAVCDINQAAIDKTVAEINSTYPDKAHGFILDLSKPESFTEVIASIHQKIGTIDILINNSGGPAPTKVSGVSPETWMSYFVSMVQSIIYLTDLVLPDMKTKGWGRIITSTSSGIITPIPNLGISNTLRASLAAWSKTLSQEIAKDGITTNIVVPGRIATQRIIQLDKAKAERENCSIEEIVKRSTTSIPVGRYGTPEEYAAVVAFLTGKSASFVNGSVIRIDGGMIASI